MSDQTRLKEKAKRKKELLLSLSSVKGKLFEDDDKIAVVDDEVVDVESEESWEKDDKIEHVSDARRRLEDLLDERKLREELDDYFLSEEN